MLELFKRTVKKSRVAMVCACFMGLFVALHMLAIYIHIGVNYGPDFGWYAFFGTVFVILAGYVVKEDLKAPKEKRKLKW